MSSATFITARDLFLAHHWNRYVPFERTAFAGFTCGRIVVKDREVLVVRSEGTNVTVVPRGWAIGALREPKAAESSPPVHEVLSVGDWVGTNGRGDTILFAPCATRGATAMQDGVLFESKSKAWADFLSVVRNFFNQGGFLEMTTPTLSESPGTEPFLDPLSVETETDAARFKKYLITSPEFSLKKALAAGAPRIFEIAKCFRNREGGAHHRIEFHMLEWYRAFASLDEIADDTENLLRAFVPELQIKRTTMREIYLEFAGLDLAPDTTRDQLAAAAKDIGIRFTPGDDFGDIFNRIFLERIEPRIAETREPLLISGYPASMAALARIRPDGFADRFEIYWRGLELCNAFHELNDPSENRKRFEQDNRAKIKSGREAVPIDQELMRAFDLGMPPSGGIALGLERLFMAIFAKTDIADVRPFLLP